MYHRNNSWSEAEKQALRQACLIVGPTRAPGSRSQVHALFTKISGTERTMESVATMAKRMDLVETKPKVYVAQYREPEGKAAPEMMVLPGEDPAPCGCRKPAWLFNRRTHEYTCLYCGTMRYGVLR